MNAAKNVAWYTTTRYVAWHAVRYAAKNAAWNRAMYDAGENDVTDLQSTTESYLKAMKLTEPNEIGKKSYQITECLMLLTIDQNVCYNIKAIVEQHLNGIPHPIPNNMLTDNPFIRLRC